MAVVSGQQQDTQVTTPQADPPRELQAITNVGRTASLAATPRFDIRNLGMSVSSADPTILESTISSAASTLRDAVRSPLFRTFIERALSMDGNLCPEQFDLVFPAGSDRNKRITALVGAALTIIDNGVDQFRRQAETLIGKGQTLPDEQVTLYKLATHPKIAGAPVREFVDEYVADPKKRDGLVGLLRTSIKEAMGAALVVSGATLREQGTAQRHIVNIRALHLPFFARPDGNPVHEKYDVVRIALAARHQNPEQVQRFLLNVSEMPRIPLGPLRDELSLQLTNRMQRAVATLLIRHRDDQISAAHFKTVDILSDIFREPGVLFHPYRNDNDAAVVDQIYRGVKAGTITIAAASCPNYSGSYQADPKSGLARWEYDFASLGSNPGFVAERGLDYVQAWHAVLQRHLGESNVRFVHYQGTFEVATGFKSNTPDGSGDLNYEQAVTRLTQSNGAVQRLYADRCGIALEPRLTNEVIPDATFLERKEGLANVIRRRIEAEPEVAAMADFIVQGRMGLYSKWFPMDPSSETEDQYVKRIKSTVVPENIAEYMLLGEILSGTNGGALVLAYDSPIMGEVYALGKLAVISGQGATAAGYLGA